ncbi:MAG: hypothetical protein JWQ75_2076, partial [Pseudarthrobacter sp.]|nr:hypothetical protein [Pseudarthrobacter sp.]
VTAGEQQPESDHHFAGESTRAGGSDGVHWRSATGWFSYVLADAEGSAGVLRVRFRPVGTGQGHELRLDGVPLGEPNRTHRSGDADELDYALPPRETGRLVFSVHALPGSTSGDLLSVQLLRADATL